VALESGAAVVVQMDADWSHDPATLAALIGPIVDDDADLVIGSRYTTGGGVVDWGLGRRLISRGGSLFAKTVLRLAPSDLTGGFKAWRARIREVPIIFRDRRVGQSKMSRRIVVEALVVVVMLRFDELRGRLTGRLPRGVKPVRDEIADASLAA